MKSFDSRLVHVIHIVFVQFGPVFWEPHIRWHTILSIASSEVASEIALVIKSAIAVGGTGTCLLVQFVQTHRAILLRDEQNVPKVREHSSSDAVVTRSSIGVP